MARFGLNFLAKRTSRAEPRSKTLLSMADSLATIASALKIIVLREYSLDLNAPPPSKRDLRVEIFEPMFANNEREAIREEIERLEQIERDLAAEDGVRARGERTDDEKRDLDAKMGGEVGPGARGTAGPASLRMHAPSASNTHDEELTEREEQFLEEIEGLDAGERSWDKGGG